MENLSTNPVPATEPRKVVVNCCADANAAVAEHCMGWEWRSNVAQGYTLLLPPGWKQMFDAERSWIYVPDNSTLNLICGSFGPESLDCTRRHSYVGIPHYCSDPTASFALEERMREMGWQWYLTEFRKKNKGDKFQWRCSIEKTRDGLTTRCYWHSSRFIGMVLTALSACGVEVELVEGWESR